MSIYSQVKEQVSTRTAAEYYGFKISRSGMMRCPFHNDRTPSMKVDRNFICFGCQEKGDVIHFVSRLYGLSAYEAAEKLIADMGLRIDRKDTQHTQLTKVRKITPVTRKQAGSHLFDQAIDRIYILYCDYLLLLNEWAGVYAPRSPDETLHPRFAEAMHMRDRVEHLLDLLLSGSGEDKAMILIDKGKGAKGLEKRIHQYRSESRERSA